METRDVYREIIDRKQHIDTINTKQDELVVAMASYYAERILSNVAELHEMINTFDALYATIQSQEENE